MGANRRPTGWRSIKGNTMDPMIQTVQRPVGQQLRQSDQSPWTAKSFVSRGSKYSAYSSAAKGRWLAEAGASRAAHPASVARQTTGGQPHGQRVVPVVPAARTEPRLAEREVPAHTGKVPRCPPTEPEGTYLPTCLALLLTPSLWVWGNFLASRSILASVGFLSLSPSNLAFGSSRDRGELDLIASSFPRRLRAFLSTVRAAPSVLPQSFQLPSYFGALRVPNHPLKLQRVPPSAVSSLLLPVCTYFILALCPTFLASIQRLLPPWAPTVSPRISSADIDTSKQHSHPLLLHLAAFPSWVASPWSWLSSSPSSSLVVPLSATQEPSPSQGSQGPRPPPPWPFLVGQSVHRATPPRNPLRRTVRSTWVSTLQPPTAQGCLLDLLLRSAVACLFLCSASSCVALLYAALHPSCHNSIKRLVWLTRLRPFLPHPRSPGPRPGRSILPRNLTSFTFNSETRPTWPRYATETLPLASASLIRHPIHPRTLDREPTFPPVSTPANDLVALVSLFITRFPISRGVIISLRRLVISALLPECRLQRNPP